jgi:hypothetical protein
MSNNPTVPRSNISNVISFACLVLQAAWVLLCYVLAVNADPGNWLAGIGGMIYSVIGCCILSAVGTAFGIAARHSSAGVIALVLNALVFLVTGFLVLQFLVPFR